MFARYMQLLISLFFLLQQGSPSPTPPPPLDTVGTWNNWVIIATIVGAVFTMAGAIFTFLSILPPFYALIKARLDRRSIKKRIRGVPGSNEELEEAFRNFVPPKSCDDAPMDGEAPASSNGARRLFDSLDEKLTHPNTYKY